MARKKSKPRGHYCWCCGRQRPNERFSGHGRKRHVCRECMRLGPDELAYAQACRDIGRVEMQGSKRATRARKLARFLEHSDPRLRALAQAVLDPLVEVREDPCVFEGDEDTPWEIVDEWRRGLLASCSAESETTPTP